MRAKTARSVAAKCAIEENACACSVDVAAPGQAGLGLFAALGVVAVVVTRAFVRHTDSD